MEEIQRRLEQIQREAQELLREALRDNSPQMLELLRLHPDLEVLLQIQVIPKPQIN